MPGRIKAEIKQEKAMSLVTEAHLNIQRTAGFLMDVVTEVLKPADLSPQQFNVLRILRGAGPDGLPCREVGARMVTREPDVTRMLDRMEARGLISRSRESKDRRVVTIRITRAGLDALRGADQPVESAVEERMRGIGERRLRAVIEVLESIRESEEKGK